MVNPLYSFNYFPLVSGSVGQDSLDSSDSCSKKTHPHGKICVHLRNLWEINLSVGENTHPRAHILQKKCQVLNKGSLSASAG